MTQPNADQQVYNTELGLDPTDPTGFAQYWMSHVRARKIKGSNINKEPYTRTWKDPSTGQTINTAASPSEQDKGTAVADGVGFRYVDSTNDVVDVGDILIVLYEYFLIHDPAGMQQAIVNASVFRKWPAAYTGIAPFEQGT